MDANNLVTLLNGAAVKQFVDFAPQMIMLIKTARIKVTNQNTTVGTAREITPRSHTYAHIT